MTSLSIELADRSYPIEIGEYLLSDTARFASFIRSSAVIITNDTVAPLYLDTLTATLQQLNIPTRTIILPDGESYKSAESLHTIYDQLLEWRCDRSTTLIALGGGVIGDLVGFAAATYQRGVPYIQVPTTLLAQVDSSVGGKTAINHPRGKNMIGAFYQPKLVVADTKTLATLTERDYRSGLAEVIKYGLIADREFFDWLETHIDQLLAQDTEALTFAIYRSCLNKKRIVDKDEKETGQRALLNLGHTFGHAIETGSGYGQWRHGEAVAIGIMMAADLSHRLGYLTSADVQRIETILTTAKLPTRAPELHRQTWLNLMALDKKNQQGQLRFVLLRSIGEALITSDVPEQHLYDTLTAMTVRQ